MPDLPILVLGSRDPALRKLVAQLRRAGFWSDDSEPTDMTEALEQSVRAFQQGHVDARGEFLSADGVVGPSTWWALENAEGEAQRSHLRAHLPAGLGPLRTKILEVALAEHEMGVQEQPSRSNRGPEVDKYLPEWARSVRVGPPWCCFFYSWVVKQALGQYPLGEREGSCARARRRAGERKLWRAKSMGAAPLPGDAFVIDHGGGSGHIGFVLRVSEDGSEINTVEGNCSDRVKLGLRSLRTPHLLGYIDNVPGERPEQFERGVVKVGAVDRDNTR